MKQVIVIGGGIIGLCSAYYLNRQGVDVTVIDKSGMDEGASYVNAGYFSPSHIVPLSAPGVVKKGLKWMFDPSSPFYVKPRTDLDFLKWAWAFSKSCNEKHVQRSIRVIRDISVMSQELVDEMREEPEFDFHYEKKGILMLCQTEKMLEEEIKVAGMAREIGLEVETLDETEVQKVESGVELNVVGATHFLCDSHSTPHEFMSSMKAILRNNGVEIRTQVEVTDLEMNAGKITAVHTTEGSLHADAFVLAAGSWTPLLCKKIGVKMLLQAGKGYRIDCPRPTGIAYPAILTEAKAAVTPMNGFTRFAGTMEIAGISKTVNPVRVEAIARAVNSYYPSVELTTFEMESASSGMRPVSPDGLPFIGRPASCDNLVVATGHAMMGVSMAPATGKLVSELITEKETSLDTVPFDPNRRF